MNKVLTVSELTHAIKQKLESNFGLVGIRGEVSNLRKQASGHTYFTLKDKDAQISSVLFRGNGMSLSRPLKEGDEITARGQISVYAPRGNYQLIVREVEFSGVGELLKKLHDLKIKLEALGWFAKEIKQALPAFPKKIGVITSPTGAVIQDIIHVLTRRFSGFELILNPVRVQGTGAAEEIVKAIQEMNHYKLVDVLIVGRGGGSLEDLWPFNEEIVAKAIFESKIPIISAVGHETDFTIADFVADVRAPTPSAAAEIVLTEKKAHLDHLDKTRKRIGEILQRKVRSHKQMLGYLVQQPPFSTPYAFLSPFIQKIDDVREDLDDSMQNLLKVRRMQLESATMQTKALRPSNQIGHLKETFIRYQKDLERTLYKKIYRKKERLDSLISHMQAIDPRNLLKKGYSIVFREKKDSVILSKSEVDLQETLRIQLSDGQIQVNVKEKL